MANGISRVARRNRNSVCAPGLAGASLRHAQRQSRLCDTHCDGPFDARSSTFPMVTSRELTRFRHFTSFADAFRSELDDGEIIHRRDIEPEFLVIAADIYRAISMRAQAAAVTSLATSFFWRLVGGCVGCCQFD